ncbi:MAG: XcyI family restriction endonuclease [Planctomycetota bacterium]
MPRRKARGIPVLEPKLQVAFYYLLKAMRETCLGEALSTTISGLLVPSIDSELKRYVDQESLSRLAGFGLRGERVFPVPYVITANPSLLGYYRLLYGLSQKEFYSKSKSPFAPYKILETKGVIPDRLRGMVEPLCKSLIATGQLLLAGVDQMSLTLVDDLQLLTLGPQFRGSRNTKIGQDATQEVFDLIRTMVKPYLKQATARKLRLLNDSHRTILIEFASDPDIRIADVSKSGSSPIVSVEIKGGTDVSNIHNRIGEAEKSHQKAKAEGFFECWTILRVHVDDTLARRESPTTTHFFHLDKIGFPATEEHKRFRQLLGLRLGIRMPE